ncbi:MULTISPECIES: tetratricopeptide repeat protein [Methylomonas]|uniref:Uncharacterized protein n=2 Tax=Methylomonas TaxID=416 RepID=A0A126T8J6_9GAMM|nr:MULTISPECIES: tetratricopeptide repeat protein [Methylomonas]AMK78380.1 hypothetical protein JT25_018110 [Methylomonas denitrificans]OAI04087.1 hypothetical protein A1342_06035 [Methylomonas methanica]TCV87590.1 tetratricopeptide repeat protein [Methylomonas methanica]
MSYIKFILTITLALAIDSSFAKERWQDAMQKPINPMLALTLAPPFCQGMEGIPALPAYQNKDWSKEYGGDFVFINHYCQSKPRILYYCYSYSEAEKNECVASLLPQIDYALKSAKSSYKLYPFLSKERADVFLEIGNYSDAISNYQIAINANNKFIPAYTGLANTYIKQKKYDEAEKIINIGLTHNPKKKPLLKKLEIISKLKVKK